MILRNLGHHFPYNIFRSLRSALLLASLPLLLISCKPAAKPATDSVAAAQPEAAPAKSSSAHGSLQMFARHAAIHLSDQSILQVEHLRGTAVPSQAGRPVTLDDKNSFVIHIDAAETSITDAHLSALLNQRILPESHSPIKSLNVRFVNGGISATGVLSKGIAASFEATAELVPSNDGLIHIHVSDYKAAGLIHKGLLDFFGIKISDVANDNHPAGLQFDKDDVIIQPSLIFAPPRIVGHLQSIRIDGNRFVQIFGPAPKEALPTLPLAQDSYIYFLGGTMRFGKLTMDDVDLELVDMEKQPYFDFSLDHYQDQISAGYSKSQKNLALIAYLAPYSRVAKPAKSK